MPNKKIFAGLLLLTIAVILYAALHDVTNLYIFSNFGSQSIVVALANFHSVCFAALKRLPFFALIKNYAVDFLWFLSFILIFTEILPVSSAKIQCAILILMACFSEFSQLFFSQLGTFDIVDLALYIIIAISFFCTKKRICE